MHTPTLLQTFFLSCIQAFAELLPVSSSAHVILALKWIKIDPTQPSMTFLIVMLHCGTMLAVTVVFFQRWKQHFQLQTLKFIVLATACTGCIGLSLKKMIETGFKILQIPGYTQIEDLFKSLPLISLALASSGLLILYSAYAAKPKHIALSRKHALWIGCIQGLCLPFRGFSRSGATISTGLLMGLSHLDAENFSFALAVAVTPAVLIREVFKLKTHLSPFPIESLQIGLFGFLFSFLIGMIALKILFKTLEQGKWHYFGFYSIFLSLLVGFFSFFS